MQRLKYKWTTEQEYIFQLRDYNGTPKKLKCKKGNKPLVEISPSGLLTIHKGYSWDGCTPKYKLSSGKIIGTWDGFVTYEDRQQMYYPSLVHDVLCQVYHLYHGIDFYSRKQIDVIFYDMMKNEEYEISFLMRRVYYRAVRTYARFKKY